MNIITSRKFKNTFTDIATNPSGTTQENYENYYFEVKPFEYVFLNNTFTSCKIQNETFVYLEMFIDPTDGALCVLLYEDGWSGSVDYLGQAEDWEHGYDAQYAVFTKK